MSHELSLKQWHHGYLGVILIAIGVWLGWTWLIFAGGYVLIDDLLQHLIQWQYDDTYMSPLRFLYTEWIYNPLYDEDDV